MKHVALIFAVLVLLATAAGFLFYTHLQSSIDKWAVLGCATGAVFLAIPARAELAAKTLVGLVKGAKQATPCD